MQITNVSVVEDRHFIPVKGWGSVTKTIILFSNGYTRGARATQQNLGDAVEKNYGALGLGIFLLSSVEIGGRTNLVNNLLKEAEERLKKGTEFNKSYEYNAMGTPFFKTRVTIKKLNDDMYCIGLRAAYVGDEPEIELADHLDIPRALLSCSVEVETKPLPGNRFEFDFEPILRRLDTVLETKKITGAQVAAAMLTENDDVGQKRDSVLQNKDGLEVEIQPGRVESRMKYSPNEKPRDTWTVKGSIFSGALQCDYGNKDKNAKKTPTLLITISSSQKDSWRDGLPIWRPDQQKKATDLAEKIAAALR